MLFTGNSAADDNANRNQKYKRFSDFKFQLV